MKDKTKSPSLHFGNVPYPWALHLVKHKAKFIMNPNLHRSQGIGRQRRGVLHLLLISGRDQADVGVISLFSTRDIHGYKLPFKYTRKFLQLFYHWLSEKSTCSPFASDVGCSQPIVTEGVICTFWASDWTKSQTAHHECRWWTVTQWKHFFIGLQLCS